MTEIGTRFCVACRATIAVVDYESGCPVTGRAHVRSGDSPIAKLYPPAPAMDVEISPMTEAYAKYLDDKRRGKRRRTNKRRNGPSHG